MFKIFTEKYNRFNKSFKEHPLLTNLIAAFILAIIPIVDIVLLRNKIFDFFYNKIIGSSTWRNGFIILAFLFVFTIIVTVVFLILSNFDNKNREEAANDEKLFKNLGISAVFRNSSDSDIQENNEFIFNKIQKESSHSIDFLLTTGYELLSMDTRNENREFIDRYSSSDKFRKAFFHEFLLSCKHKVRILLLNPESESAKRRGEVLFGNKAITHYQNLIFRTIAYLNDFNNSNIEFGFYNQEPIWKIVKTDSLMFVQPIRRDRYGRNENLHLFKYTPHSLTDGFHTLFEKKWDERNNFEIDRDSINKKAKKFKSK